MTAIVDIIGREILDSRGNPTVEVDVVLEDGSLEAARRERYAGWDSDRGKKLMSSSLEEITEMVLSEDLQPEPRSGRQERLENLVNRFVQKA